jgi:hypothetical protein
MELGPSSIILKIAKNNKVSEVQPTFFSLSDIAEFSKFVRNLTHLLLANLVVERRPLRLKSFL